MVSKSTGSIGHSVILRKKEFPVVETNKDLSTEWTGNLKGLHTQVCHPDQMKAFWAGMQSKVLRVRKLDHMLGLSAEPESPGETVL